jgi:hypothetical protein
MIYVLGSAGCARRCYNTRTDGHQIHPEVSHTANSDEMRIDKQKTENRPAMPFNVPDDEMTTTHVFLMRSATMLVDDDTLKTRVPVADGYGGDI